MTKSKTKLAKKYEDAGWRQVEGQADFKADKLLNVPGKTASLIEETGETLEELEARIDVREVFLGGDVSVPVRDVVTDDGSVVTTDQHEGIKLTGVVVDPATVE